MEVVIPLIIHVIDKKQVFNLITGINEFESWVKHFFWDKKCRIDSKKSTLNQKWNKDKCWCECKKALKQCT